MSQVTNNTSDAREDAVNALFAVFAIFVTLCVLGNAAITAIS